MKFVVILGLILLSGCSKKAIIDENYLINLDWGSFESQEELDSFMDSLSPELYELAITLQGRTKPDVFYEDLSNYNGEQVAFTFNPNETYVVGIDIEPGKYNVMSEDSYNSYVFELDENGHRKLNEYGDEVALARDGSIIDLEEGQQLEFTVNAKIGNMKREVLTFDKTFTDADGYFMDSSKKIYVIGEDIAEGKYRMEPHPYSPISTGLRFLDENDDVISEESVVGSERKIIYLTSGDRIQVASNLTLMKYGWEN